MKYILLLALLSIASTGCAATKKAIQPPATPIVAVDPRISQAKDLIRAQNRELQAAKDAIKAVQTELSESEGTISEQDIQINDLSGKIDAFGKKYDEAVKKADEYRVKYETLSVKVHEVSVAVGILFALVAYLLVARFLGTASVLAGPYGLYIYIAASTGAFATGLGLVELFFRHHK